MGMKALIVAICLVGAILLATRYNDISVYGYFFVVPLMIPIFLSLLESTAIGANNNELFGLIAVIDFGNC
jgi:hypothetical protein